MKQIGEDERIALVDVRACQEVPKTHSLPTIETGVHEKLRPPLDWGSDDDHGIKRNRRGGESYEHIRRNGTADVDGFGDPRWVADPTHPDAVVTGRRKVEAELAVRARNR